MPRGTRTVVRIVSIALLLIAVAPVVSGLSGRGGTPYLSALSDFAVPQSFAAQTCNFKACGGSRHNEACNPVNTASECTTYKGFCLVSNCT
jgi:hypothetical protein